MPCFPLCEILITLCSMFTESPDQATFMFEPSYENNFFQGKNYDDTKYFASSTTSKKDNELSEESTEETINEEAFKKACEKALKSIKEIFTDINFEDVD